MSFDEFLDQLPNLEKTRNFNVFKSYSLEKFESALKLLNLDRRFSKAKIPLRISVIGTNGKGSVSHFLSELAISSNLYKKVGLFTSPHLLHKEERIRLNAEKISIEKLNSLFRELSFYYEDLLSELSYFEIFTIMAFFYFQKENCDLEIYEAGLGGRFDSTKLAFSDILILTKISLDHSEILGKTEVDILKEKLAISSEYTRFLFYYNQENQELNEMISGYCKNKNIETFFFTKEFQDIDYLSYNLEFCKFIFNVIDPKFDSSVYKVKNGAPGRIEILKEEPLVVFDVAHNVSAIQYLLKSIQSKFYFHKLNVVFACLKDKDGEEMVKVFLSSPFIEKVYLYRSGEYLEIHLISEKIETISQDQLKELTQNSHLPLLVTGSFRLYDLIKRNFSG
ncbi:MAG: bifunctional folylpolyglutamate synthase/dihydrofolate synthase [Leptospiraceae bacterium]|nr:bifunctional folylpolyglutamate synthase/dihydrofolate synthase [Leptospiraceae bacterium]MCK6381966.1 bifunctional folylpolyglutamate synthase/dihydrofolate synthase [Leptospiraceae bacterium]NUM40304.1 bifunctional folylpolyglutamate synthase/dihydrofolate synthase [Leptospiraceae bacterium]